MSHIQEHCDTPKIGRAWRALGPGAVWRCTCGNVFRLTHSGGYDGLIWSWDKVS